MEVEDVVDKTFWPSMNCSADRGKTPSYLWPKKYALEFYPILW